MTQPIPGPFIYNPIPNRLTDPDGPGPIAPRTPQNGEPAFDINALDVAVANLTTQVEALRQGLPPVIYDPRLGDYVPVRIVFSTDDPESLPTQPAEPYLWLQIPGDEPTTA